MDNETLDYLIGRRHGLEKAKARLMEIVNENEETMSQTVRDMYAWLLVQISENAEQEDSVLEDMALAKEEEDAKKEVVK